MASCISVIDWYNIGGMAWLGQELLQYTEVYLHKNLATPKSELHFMCSGYFHIADCATDNPGTTTFLGGSDENTTRTVGTTGRSGE